MGNAAVRRRHPPFAAGLATLVIAAGLATAPAQAMDKTKYVALGDSYAAGQGAGPYLDDCFRSGNSYAELADGTKEVKLVTNAACSGRTTQDVVNTQLSTLNKSTELVTITAGGNNIGFGDIIASCGAALVEPTAGPACDAATSFAVSRIQSGELTSDIKTMIQRVKAAAPNAKIVVTGYPNLYDPVIPDPADPLSVFIYQATQLADGLNSSIRAAANDTKVQYADVRSGFTGHGVNSSDPWMHLDTTNPGSPDNFHPNAEGYEAYFSALNAAGVY
jgi:lysophospholipase L1-like esterase